MTQKPAKRYLGDSVYVDLNEHAQLVLTTENGYGPSNTIYLEEEVVSALLNYINDLVDAMEAAKANQAEEPHALPES